MRGWVVRALGMAAVHTAGQVTVAAAGARDADSLWLTRTVVLALVVGVAALWGALDGWRRLESAGWRWLAAGLVAGPVAGLFGVVGQGLLMAVTGGAAFTALLVTIAAWLGIVVGRLLEPPRIPPGSGATAAAAEFKPLSSAGRASAARAGTRPRQDR